MVYLYIEHSIDTTPMYLPLRGSHRVACVTTMRCL